MPSRYVLEKRIVLTIQGTRIHHNIPLLIVAPVSPLESLFMRFNANALSRSLKNDVDSGLFGNKNRVMMPNRTAGIPYILCEFQYNIGRK